jgi:general secretion pathway protein M
MISQLSLRERIVLAIGTLVVLITLLVFGVIAPYQKTMAQLDHKISSRQEQLKETQVLSQRYRQLQQKLDEARQWLNRGEAFSLFSFIEDLSSRVAGKENLVYMRPQPTSTKDGFREEAVEIKLEKIQLKQLVQLLYQIETAQAYLQIKNLRLKTRFDDRTLLDATLTVSSLGRSV